MPGIDESSATSVKYTSLKGVCGLIDGALPAQYILSYGLYWWVAPDDAGQPCLFVANEGSWEHAIHAIDVENWEGTSWEDEFVTREMIQARRDTLIEIFASVR